MIKIKAKIKLYQGQKMRQTSFRDGYRPLFNFIPEMKTSGQISLKNRSDFYPGDEGEVEITFISKDYLGVSFGPGSKFTFGEGSLDLGEGEIIKIL